MFFVFGPAWFVIAVVVIKLLADMASVKQEQTDGAFSRGVSTLSFYLGNSSYLSIAITEVVLVGMAILFGVVSTPVINDSVDFSIAFILLVITYPVLFVAALFYPIVAVLSKLRVDKRK